MMESMMYVIEECSMVVGAEELEGCGQVGNHVYLKTIYACTDQRVIQKHFIEAAEEERDHEGKLEVNQGSIENKDNNEEKNDDEDEAINEEVIENKDKLASNESAVAKDLLASYTDAALKDESRLLLLTLGLAALMAVLGVACLLVVAAARRSRASTRLNTATSTPRLDLDDVDMMEEQRSNSGSSSPTSSRLSSFSPALIPLATRYTPPAPFNDDFDQNNEDSFSNASQNVRYCTIGRVPHVPRASWHEWEASS